MNENREQIIKQLITTSLDGSQQRLALQLMSQCSEWPDFCDLLLAELQRTNNKAEEDIICVFLKQEITKNKTIRHKETIEVILCKIERIKQTGILVITHLFLLTTDEIRLMIFDWILRNIQLISAIELFQSIITDAYSTIKDRFENEITVIINRIIPLLSSDNPDHSIAIIFTLKEISYSPPSQFPNLYIDLLKLLLPQVQTQHNELKLAIGKFINESPFILNQAPVELFDMMLQACNCLISEENEEIFITGCDLLEALISRFPEKIDPFAFKTLLPRMVLNEDEISELLEGNNDDDDLEISARNSVSNLLQVALSYYPQLILIISPIIVQNMQSMNWKIAESSLQTLCCLQDTITQQIYNQYFTNMGSVLINAMKNSNCHVLLQKKSIEIIGIFINYFSEEEQKQAIPLLFTTLNSTNDIVLLSGLNAIIEVTSNNSQLIIPFIKDLYVALVQKMNVFDSQCLTMTLDLLQVLVSTVPFMDFNFLHLLIVQTVQITPKYINDDCLIEQLYITTAFIAQRTRVMHVNDIQPLLESVSSVIQFNWKRGVDDGAVSSCIQMLDAIAQINGCGILTKCGVSEILVWGVSRKERRIQVNSLILVSRIFDNDIHSINSQSLNILLDKMIGILHYGIHEGVLYSLWDIYLLICNFGNILSNVFPQIIEATLAVYNKNVMIKPPVLKRNILCVLIAIAACSPNLIIPYIRILTNEDLLPHCISIPNERHRLNMLRIIGMLIISAPQDCKENIVTISNVYQSVLQMFPQLNEIWIRIQRAFSSL